MTVDVVGKKIVSIRKLTKEELEAEGWNDYSAIALVLDDGTLIYPSCDEEGNNPGQFFISDGKKTYNLYC